MLGKCANPMCAAIFRKLGHGKLFAFESIAMAKSIVPGSSSGMRNRRPEFFWLCECCSTNFTLLLDSAGDLIMRSISQGARDTLFDGVPAQSR
jgi:hypothetical protein